MAKPLWERNVGQAARLLVAFGLLAFMLMGFITFTSYLNYSEERANREACHDRFGPMAEYVGETGGIHSDSAVICVVNGEQELMPQPTYGMAPLGEFISAVMRGDA